MNRAIVGISMLLLAVLLGVASTQSSVAASDSCSDEDFCFSASSDATPQLIEDVTLPEIAVPYWMDGS